MFISYNEKKDIKDQISSMNAAFTDAVTRLDELESRVRLWEAHCRHVESKLGKLSQSLLKPEKVKRTLTPEQRERQRAYVRAYNARKKAEKAQQVAA